MYRVRTNLTYLPGEDVLDNNVLSAYDANSEKYKPMGVEGTKIADDIEQPLLKYSSLK